MQNHRSSVVSAHSANGPTAARALFRQASRPVALDLDFGENSTESVQDPSTPREERRSSTPLRVRRAKRASPSHGRGPRSPLGRARTGLTTQGTRQELGHIPENPRRKQRLAELKRVKEKYQAACLLSKQACDPWSTPLEAATAYMAEEQNHKLQLLRRQRQEAAAAAAAAAEADFAAAATNATARSRRRSSTGMGGGSPPHASPSPNSHHQKSPPSPGNMNATSPHHLGLTATSAFSSHDDSNNLTSNIGSKHTRNVHCKAGKAPNEAEHNAFTCRVPKADETEKGRALIFDGIHLGLDLHKPRRLRSSRHVQNVEEEARGWFEAKVCQVCPPHAQPSQITCVFDSVTGGFVHYALAIFSSKLAARHALIACQRNCLPERVDLNSIGWQRCSGAWLPPAAKEGQRARSVEGPQ